MVAIRYLVLLSSLNWINGGYKTLSRLFFVLFQTSMKCVRVLLLSFKFGLDEELHLFWLMDFVVYMFYNYVHL